MFVDLFGGGIELVQDPLFYQTFLPSGLYMNAEMS
jgi:hypothetical protein